MYIPANIIGILAVASFVLSYQIKNRRGIVAVNAISRSLYVLQYIMLKAYEGAVLDVVGILASVLAQNKDKGVIKKYIIAVIIAVNLLIIVCGIALYESPVSLLPMVGVLLHTGAFWFSNERTIRMISFLGSPFWFAYNLISGAYGSAIGDLLTMVSIGTAIVRYDILGRKNEK